MFEPNYLSIICTRCIVVRSLGFEPNVMGSNPTLAPKLFSLFLSIRCSGE